MIARKSKKKTLNPKKTKTIVSDRYLFPADRLIARSLTHVAVSLIDFENPTNRRLHDIQKLNL